MTFSTLASPGVSLQGGGGSGGGTPGGSNTQIQYNSSGTFAGASGLTTNGTELTIASGTKTADAPALDMSQTWNNAGVTFMGLKFNATDTASNSASLLMDLQIGGSSRFALRKDGYLQLNGTGASLAASSCGVGTLGTGLFHAGADAGGLRIGASADVILSRRGAANLRLGAADAAAPVAQTLSVQSVVAGTSNTAGANLTITGSQGTGTGAGGSIVFQVAPAGSSGTAQNALATALTINSARQVIIEGNGSTIAPALGFASLEQTGFYVNGGFLAISRANNLVGQFGQFALQLSTSYGIEFSFGGGPILRNDGSQTLALRNGANAQTFNLYSTYTDASNYERMSLGYSASNDFTLTTSKAGTGSNRSLTFETYGAATFTIAAQTIATSSDGFFSWSSTTTSRGSTDTRLYRDAAGVIGVRGTSSTGGAALSFVEQTAPAAPATNGVRIYAEDNGSGKTRLMALFATGAAVQIAIEP